MELMSYGIMAGLGTRVDKLKSLVQVIENAARVVQDIDFTVVLGRQRRDSAPEQRTWQSCRFRRVVGQKMRE